MGLATHRAKALCGPGPGQEVEAPVVYVTCPKARPATAFPLPGDAQPKATTLPWPLGFRRRNLVLPLGWDAEAFASAA
ncbi:hypothetical protein GCM10017783_25390 [Deinococcus piscis]|uniref:Uncharacterized protein n=1 Tax=Deinococcus piscis TaxID=394230 RepID=A0ABQ3KEF0_9DEIO|nr:hypothetical protein GCM10017783_25390 [Deinococcus piscis]